MTLGLPHPPHRTAPMNETSLERPLAPHGRVSAVVAAEPAGGFVLALTFEDGRRRLFDVAPFLPSPDGTRGTAFRALLEPAYFRRVRVEDGTVVWPDGQDFDPATLHAQSVPAPD